MTYLKRIRIFLVTIISRSERKRSIISRKIRVRYSTVPIANVNTQKYWNEIWRREGIDSRNYEELHRVILDQIIDNCFIVDLGCGNGQLLRKALNIKNAHGVGLDLSTEALGLIHSIGVDVVQAKLPKIPLASNSFDCVLCTETLEHLDEPQIAIAEMYRIAKENGLILFSVPDGSIWPLGGEHVQEFKPNDCIDALRPYVRRVFLMTLVDSDGYPFLVCWGKKRNHRVLYAKGLKRSSDDILQRQ